MKYDNLIIFKNSVNVKLRQGCVISPWLFNVDMDGVVREVNARVRGKGLECWQV